LAISKLPAVIPDIKSEASTFTIEPFVFDFR